MPVLLVLLALHSGLMLLGVVLPELLLGKFPRVAHCMYKARQELHQETVLVMPAPVKATALALK